MRRSCGGRLPSVGWVDIPWFYSWSLGFILGLGPSLASVGQATAPEGHPGAGLSVPDRQKISASTKAQDGIEG